MVIYPIKGLNSDELKTELSYIASKYGLVIKDIMTPCHFPNVVKARNDAIFFVRIQYGISLEKIGKIFKMHHSSIGHAINRHLYAD